MQINPNAPPQIGGLFDGPGGAEAMTTLMHHDGDLRALQPWSDGDGKVYITRNIKGKETTIQVYNNTAALPKDVWIQLDQSIMRVAKPVAAFVNSLEAAGAVYTIPDALGKTVLQYQRVTDIGPAIISMDPSRRSEGDRPLFDLVNMPLPVIHKDWDYEYRQVLASRNGGEALDTLTGELAGIRCMETAEMLALGILPSYTFANGTIYGVKNFPNRITVNITDPNGSNQATTVQDVLGMVNLALAAFHRGPFTLYYGLLWEQYMNSDYNLYRGLTLKERLLQNDRIQAVELLEFMRTGYDLLLVEKNAMTIRIINGFDLMNIQWQSEGGMKLHFKTMLMKLPQMRCDLNGNTGIVHGLG